MKSFGRLLSVFILGTALVFPTTASAAAGKKDRCLVNRNAPGGTPLNTFVFRAVEDLTPGDAIDVRGIFFTVARKPAPFHGAAIMGTDGKVRLGIFVHSIAESTNDFTMAGVVDADFAGEVKFDSTGTFVPNGTLTLELVSCDTISVP